MDSAMSIQYIPKKLLPFQKLSEEVWRRYISKERVTIANFQLKKGATIPEHHHPNEQISFIISGKVKMTMQGKSYTLEEGDMIVIPKNIPHAIEALDDTRALDIFTPPREDWLKGNDSYSLEQRSV